MLVVDINRIQLDALEYILNVNNSKAGKALQPNRIVKCQPINRRDCLPFHSLNSTKPEASSRTVPARRLRQGESRVSSASVSRTEKVKALGLAKTAAEQAPVVIAAMLRPNVGRPKIDMSK
jgi:hypothetical protein